MFVTKNCMYISFLQKSNMLDSATDNNLMKNLMQVKEKSVQVEERKAEALERKTVES